MAGEVVPALTESERVDFSRNASVYDRRHGAALSAEAVKRLWDVAGLPSHARVLDVGAGTGRVAIPLARHGCHVVAVDLDRTMPMPRQLDWTIYRKDVASTRR